jgi:hypothetical protein
MILYYSIPHKLEEIIPFEENERIYYAVPVDIDDKGNWIKDSYLVVTTKKIHVYDGEKITNTIEINKCSKAKAEAKVEAPSDTVAEPEVDIDSTGVIQSDEETFEDFGEFLCFLHGIFHFALPRFWFLYVHNIHNI